MKILRRLIRLHKLLSITAILFSFLPVILNLCWNNFLAKLIDIFGYAAAGAPGNRTRVLFTFLPSGIFIILLHSVSEYVSSCLASFTCEMFAHEMRIGYARYFLQSDIRVLSKFNVGEEQSAMQNELKDISDYLRENFFPLIKQFGTFAVTAAFLLYKNHKLALLSHRNRTKRIYYESRASKRLCFFYAAADC